MTLARDRAQFAGEESEVTRRVGAGMKVPMPLSRRQKCAYYRKFEGGYDLPVCATCQRPALQTDSLPPGCYRIESTIMTKGKPDRFTYRSAQLEDWDKCEGCDLFTPALAIVGVIALMFALTSPKEESTIILPGGWYLK